jgi:hypothetical protein
MPQPGQSFQRLGDNGPWRNYHGWHIAGAEGTAKEYFPFIYTLSPSFSLSYSTELFPRLWLFEEESMADLWANDGGPLAQVDLTPKWPNQMDLGGCQGD